MADIHDLIEAHGYQQARRMASDPAVVDAAAAMMQAETETLGTTYSGFALTSLPHRKLKNDPEASWRRQGYNVRLLIEPGRLPVKDDYRLFGVPYGSQARLILIYLQSEAIRRQSPEIELGRSMYEWLQRMNIPCGGTTYKAIREQASRLSACLLTFAWDDGRKIAFQRDSIVRSGLFLHEQPRDLRQQSLWSEHVVLSETFYNELRTHAVPLSEEALAQINGSSLAIDVYIWLAYRLHSLKKPTKVSWQAMHSQFGPDYARLRDFRKRFRRPLKMALAIYPDAKVEINEAGATLYPSRPPVAPRQIQSLVPDAVAHG